MNDLNQLLAQYYDIVQQLRQLEEQKAELRKEITAAVSVQGGSAALTIDGTTVSATVRRSIRVEYDEAGLRARLGERFQRIVAPDPKKVNKHLDELHSALTPYLDTIGSVSRDLVAEEIEAGNLSKDDFAGLFTKEQKDMLVVKMIDNRSGDQPN